VDGAKIWASLIAATASVIVATISGLYSVNANSKMKQMESETPGSLGQGQKLCRIFHKNGGAEGLIVPQNWNLNLCKDYMHKIDGADFQLGCVSTTGTALGGLSGRLPVPNSCGWN
jgi:hypothetical protein